MKAIGLYLWRRIFFLWCSVTNYQNFKVGRSIPKRYLNCSSWTLKKSLRLLTCLLRRQWNIKIIKPWSELKMANMYLNATVDELKVRSPNNQVIPSKGRMTAVALSPALTFSTCVLFCTCRVPIICRITKTNTTMLICGETSLSIYFKL